MDEFTRKTLSVRIRPVEVAPTAGPPRQKVWRRRSPNVGYYQNSCVHVDFSFFADVVKFVTTGVPMSCQIIDAGLPPNAPGAAFHSARANVELVCPPMVSSVVYTVSHPQYIEIVNYGSLPGKSYCTDPNVKGMFVKEGVPTDAYDDLGSISVTITTENGEVITSLPLLLAAAETHNGIPFAPSGLNGIAYSSPRRVVLGWTAGEGHTSYEIQRMTGSGSYVTLTPPPAGATTYTDTTVPVGGNMYRIRGGNPYGSSAWATSNVVGV